MRDDLRALVRHFMTPEDHRGNPAGFVLTQAAHFGAVGGPACWIALVAGASPLFALALVAAGYALIEAAQARFGRQTLADAATDEAFVLLGAGFLASAVTGLTFLAGACLAGAIVGAALGGAARRG